MSNVFGKFFLIVADYVLSKELTAGLYQKYFGISSQSWVYFTLWKRSLGRHNKLLCSTGYFHEHHPFWPVSQLNQGVQFYFLPLQNERAGLNTFVCNKANLLLLKLIQIFARAVLVMKKLEIKETRPPSIQLLKLIQKSGLSFFDF